MSLTRRSGEGKSSLLGRYLERRGNIWEKAERKREVSSEHYEGRVSHENICRKLHSDARILPPPQ